MSLVNKVAQSGLLTFSLETLAPDEPTRGFDLAPYLFRGLVLREKDFRQALAETDWSGYQGSWLAVYCSADAIIPVWAYMLVAVHAEPFTNGIFRGTPAELETQFFLERIRNMDLEPFRDARVVVKGCADRQIPEAAFLAITQRLKPVVRSLFYGEPCSTVPLYKRNSP